MPTREMEWLVSFYRHPLHDRPFDVRIFAPTRQDAIKKFLDLFPGKAIIRMRVNVETSWLVRR